MINFSANRSRLFSFFLCSIPYTRDCQIWINSTKLFAQLVERLEPFLNIRCYVAPDWKNCSTSISIKNKKRQLWLQMMQRCKVANNFVITVIEFSDFVRGFSVRCILFLLITSIWNIVRMSIKTTFDFRSSLFFESNYQTKGIFMISDFGFSNNIKEINEWNSILCL